MPELPGIADTLAPTGMNGQGLVAIPLTAPQIASPTSVILANVTATFYLNAPPYTRYQSNGTSLVAIGAGGGGGGGTQTPVTYATTIPLDTVDPGKVMTTDGLAPAGTNERNLITTNTVMIPGARVPAGYCQVTVYMNGTNTLDLSAFNCISGSSLLAAGVLTGTAGRAYAIQFASIASAPVLAQVGVADLGAVDITAPTLVSAAVANATPTHVDLVFSEAMNATWSAASAFTVSGHTVSSITRVTATTGYLTLSAPFVNGEAAQTLGYTQPGSNKMQDLAGNLLANIASASITNNVTATAFRFGTVASPLVETGVGPYVYTNPATAQGAGTGGTYKFPAGVAASLTMQFTAEAATLYGMWGIDSDNTTVRTNSSNCVLALHSDAGFTAGCVGTTDVTTYTALGTIDLSTTPYWRFSRDVSNVLKIESSPDNVTFTSRRTYAGSNVDYFMKMSQGAASTGTTAVTFINLVGMT